MLSKRVIITLTYNHGVLFRTRFFKPDYRYTSNFIDTWSVDEIIILDITRNPNLNDQKEFEKILDNFAKNCFVPITVGGKIKNVKDVKNKMRIGADKISINSAAIESPELIRKISDSFGSQAVVCSIDFKKKKKKNTKFFLIMDRKKQVFAQLNGQKKLKNLVLEKFC